MAITNYVTLQAAVADWAERSDLTTQIPYFIRQAHDAITREIVIGADLTFTTATVALPSDFREVVSLWPMAYATAPLTLATALEMASQGTGRPRFYRISSTNVLLAPAPEETYAARLLYRLSRTAFSADADTNAALTRYPYLYLHGALAELFRFLRDRDGEATYQGRFNSELVDAIRAETAQVTQGAMLQTQQSLTAV